MANKTEKNAPETCSPRISTIITSLATASANSTRTSVSGCQSAACEDSAAEVVAMVSSAICAAGMSRFRSDTTLRSSAGVRVDLMRLEDRVTGHPSGLVTFLWRATMAGVRGRLAPLAVRPFGRLLSSYTLNELGDSVGIVALAVLVWDRTEAVAPTTAFFLAAKFLPALLAPALTARIDQVALRSSLPAVYLAEAAVFALLALIAHTDFVLLPVLVLGLVDGTLALTGRSLTRGAVAAVLQPTNQLKEGNALMNVGFALSSVGGAALAGLLIATLGISTALLV